MIETSPGSTLGYYSWRDSQEPYHYFNSNGSTLVNPPATQSINGIRYNIFTVKKSGCRAVTTGNSLVNSSLPIGTLLATNECTVGATNDTYMYFNYYKIPGMSWASISPSAGGFVDLQLVKGNMPTDRAIW